MFYWTRQSHSQFIKGTAASALKSRDHKDFTDIVQEDSVDNTGNRKYILRRLTPTECLRLQGIPDWWCDGLEITDPTLGQIQYWHNVLQTHQNITKPRVKQPVTLNRVRKWLKNPKSDSAVYKMAGNGIAIPCAYDVLGRLAEELQRNE